MRVCAGIGIAALLSGAVFGQSTESTPKFEVADIHASPRTTQPFVRGPFYNSGRYELRFATMLDLVRTAYGVDPEKIMGGPNWIEMDRFDVFAMAPAASTAESRKLMLQALLADRFKLATHKDSKPIAAFALKASKKTQLKEPEGNGANGCNFNVQNTTPPPPGGGPPTGPINLPVIVYTCHNTTMAAFADGMLSMAGAGQYFNNRLVVDQTELQGSWDFTFKFTPKIPAGITTVGENIPLFDALEKQLGLRLEAATVPMPVIVLDSVNQKPTDNAPDVAKSFPPLPTEFDAAEIKPAVAQTGGGRGGTLARPEIKNGRIYVPNITLKNLITLAWDINGDDMLSGAPKWLDSDRFDLIAKAPAGVAIGDLTPSRNAVPINIEALRPMIKALIVERFKLQSHMESKPIAAYTLVAAKPKLKKADPATRTKWQEGALPDSKDNKNANPSLGRLVTCQNVTMAQFAQLLPVIAPGYLHTEVTDATGLEGGWDFTFSFSPAGILQLNGAQGGGGEGGASSAGPVGEASVPSGAVSLFDAMTRQLGLKLEMQKRPTPVLVIDHIEQKPTDN